MDMLSQLDDASLQIVCHGHQNRSGGVVRCLLMPRPNSYDHKRHHALRLANTPVEDRRLQVWDFVIIRKDGTAIRLHPQWSTTKIEAFPAQGYLEPVQHPAKGKGQSLGPGTYAWFKETIGTAETLRFDAKYGMPFQHQREVPLAALEDRPGAASSSTATAPPQEPPPQDSQSAIADNASAIGAW